MLEAPNILPLNEERHPCVCRQATLSILAVGVLQWRIDALLATNTRMLKVTYSVVGLMNLAETHNATNT